jgi:hypothetical protein
MIITTRAKTARFNSSDTRVTVSIPMGTSLLLHYNEATIFDTKNSYPTEYLGYSCVLHAKPVYAEEIKILVPTRNRDSSVDTVTRLWNRRTSNLVPFPRGRGNYFLSEASWTVLETTQPPLPQVKAARTWIEHWFPSSSEVKNRWNYTPVPPTWLRAAVLN